MTDEPSEQRPTEAEAFIENVDSLVTDSDIDPLTVATALREYARQIELNHAYQLGRNDEPLYGEHDDE